MTRKEWTTPPQKAWLYSQSEKFQKAEANNTRKEFFKDTYKAWWVQWPNQEPTQAEISKAGSCEKAVKIIYDKRSSQISSWFHNHKRPTLGAPQAQPSLGGTNGASPSANGTLKFKKKRMLQAWQAYHDLFYEIKWKAVINEQWAEHVKQWKSAHPGQALEETRFAFMNAFIKARYKDEPEDVKKQVEEHRRKM
ncbi:hypothetical protein CPB84DRAFT_1628468, partial [Gymnopilus junonius]